MATSDDDGAFGFYPWDTLAHAILVGTETEGEIVTTRIARPKRRAQPEAALQRDVYEYLPVALPKTAMFRMIENRPRSRIAGALQKRRGIAAGTPDVLIWWRQPDGLGSAAIELKSRNGVQSKAQEVFQTEFEYRVGGLYAICRSVDEVRAFLRDKCRIKLRA